MKRQVLAAVCGLLLVLAFGACRNKEEKSVVPQTVVPETQKQLSPGQQENVTQGDTKKGQTTVPLPAPEIVKSKGKAATVAGRGKNAKKKDEDTINIRRDSTIPLSSDITTPPSVPEAGQADKSYATPESQKAKLIPEVPSGPEAGLAKDTGATPELPKARLIADVASKRALRLIIRDALASGMSVQDVVTTLIRADVAPPTVVYAVVSEGGDALSAVNAAALFCCESGRVRNDVLQAIVSAAITAGADRNIVMKAALSAGCPAADIASAISFAESSAAPVHGQASPSREDLPARYIPITPVIIGGGGGTSPASPSKP